MTTLYLFKTHKANVTNLVQSLTMYSARDKQLLSLDNCFTSLNSENFFINATGNLPRQCTLGQDPTTAFRIFSWAANDHSLEHLNQSIAKAKTENKIYIIGSHSDEEIFFLKDHFKDSITTIGIHYNQSNLLFLLQDVARYHVYLLTNNQLTPTDSDAELLQKLSVDQLVDEYYNRFRESNYLPVQCDINCDHNIHVDDFFNPTAVENFMKKINLPLTSVAQIIYNNWLLNQPYFRK